MFDAINFLTHEVQIRAPQEVVNIGALKQDLARGRAEVFPPGRVTVGSLDALIRHPQRPALSLIALASGLKAHGMLQDPPVKRLHEIAVDALLFRERGNLREQFPLTRRVAQRQLRVALERRDFRDQLLAFRQRADEAAIHFIETLAQWLKRVRHGQ